MIAVFATVWAAFFSRKENNVKLSILASALMLSLSSIAFAHGAKGHDDEHGKGHTMQMADPSIAEQTPFGVAGDPKKVTRIVKISMSDQMRFSPDVITVKQGETVKLSITNDGKILHEMILGTLKDFKEHAEMMRKNPGMQHDDPQMTHVEPGQTGEIVWTFDKAGEFDFACLVPGHFEAGMKGKIKVTAGKAHT